MWCRKELNDIIVMARNQQRPKYVSQRDSHWTLYFVCLGKKDVLHTILLFFSLLPKQLYIAKTTFRDGWTEMKRVRKGMKRHTLQPYKENATKLKQKKIKLARMKWGDKKSIRLESTLIRRFGEIIFLCFLTCIEKKTYIVIFQ